jgi:hypothetical protein
MSTLFEMFNGPQQPQQPQPPAPIPNQNGNFFAQLLQFAKTFSGNPEQIGRNLLQTGQMSQQEFNQLGQQASQIQAMMGLR